MAESPRTIQLRFTGKFGSNSKLIEYIRTKKHVQLPINSVQYSTKGFRGVNECEYEQTGEYNEPMNE